MPPTLVKRVAVRFGLVAALIIAAAICSWLSTTWYIEISNQVEHSRKVIVCLTELQSFVKDAETGQRGFLLTRGKPEYLEPYDKAIAAIEPILDDLAVLADNDQPSQRQMLEKLRPLIRQKLAELAKTIRLHKSGNVESAIALVNTDEGNHFMDKIREIFKRGFAFEQQRLEASAATASSVRGLMVALNVSCSIITLSLLVTVFFHIRREISHRTRVEAELWRTRDAAESNTRAKGEFLANMSHEIRTPMNGILGMTELALGTRLTSRQREYLGLVKSSADALLIVIDDILDFSKIEAGKLTLEPIPFSPGDVVTDILRAMALKAHEKGLELACRVSHDVPDSVVGDPGRVRQVLVNLVGNAIKFTEKGEVVVTVEPALDSDAPATLRFSVADTGIGIAPEKRVAIFAPFEQADGSTTRKYGGTGLGLTISTRLIALMNGRISVEENPGGGTIFRFTARLDGDPESYAAPTPAQPVALEGLRVLIVDDNQTNRMILEELLSQWGCRPRAVEDGEEALRVMARAADRGDPYPTVLLDRLMPVMDGCELARRIHADPRHAATRMLMLTSGGPDDSLLIRDLGIGGVLAKPVRQSELLNAVLDLIGVVIDPASTASPEPIPTTAILPAIRRLRVLLAEDHLINQKVATRMLEDQGHEVTLAANGRLALQAIASSAAFDVILMDVQMPEMDGFEATAAIRSGERDGRIRLPIVALTAHAMAGDRERCLASGFDDYLAKPLSAASLAGILARVVGNGHTSAPRTEILRDDGPAFDLEAALQGLGGDEQLLDEILGIFLDDAPRLLAEVRSAVDAGDSLTLGRLGHTLAGSAGHLSAPGVIASARKLEAMGKAGNLDGAEVLIHDFHHELDRFRLATAEVRT